MRALWLLVTAAGVLAFSAVPNHEPGWMLLRVNWHTLGLTSGSALAPIDGAARWAECRSLLLVAGGFFAMAFLIRRRG